MREMDKRGDVHLSLEATLPNVHIAFLNILVVLFRAYKTSLLPESCSRALACGTLRKKILGGLSSSEISDMFDIDRIFPLLLEVLNKESDIVIWIQVTSAFRGLPPPPPALPVPDQTPYTCSLHNCLEHRKYMDAVLKVELVLGLYLSFFASMKHSKTREWVGLEKAAALGW